MTVFCIGVYIKRPFYFYNRSTAAYSLAFFKHTARPLNNQPQTKKMALALVAIPDSEHNVYNILQI